MNKVNLISRVPPQYYSPAFTAMMRDLEQTLARGGDAYLFRVVTTAVDYTCHVGDSIIVVRSDNVTITLPRADQTKEKRFTVKNGSAIGEGSPPNTTTVQAASGNIDGFATYSMSVALEAADFVSDGTNYWIV